MKDQTTKQQEWLAAGELERRQHIIVKGAGMATVYAVEHSLPYRSGPDPMVMLSLTPVGDGEPPLAVRWSADYQVRLASEDQVAEAGDAAHRRQLVAGLRDVIDLIEKHELRFKRFYGLDVTSALVDGEVSRLAELVGGELSAYGNTQKSLRLDLRASDAGAGVGVSLHGVPAPEPEPEAEQEWLFTFGSGQQHDGRFVRITGTHESARARMVEVFGTAWCDQYDWRRFDELGLMALLTELPEADWPTTEHQFVAGTAGGPGENSAVCACGFTVDGFDSQREAIAWLAQHIANPEPAAGPAGA